MLFRIALTERNAAVNATTSLFNKSGNPNPTTLNIYSNATSPPSGSPEATLPSGSVLLSVVPMSSVAFATANGGTGLAYALPLQAFAINSGVAGWFRFLDGQSSPAVLCDGDISQTGGSGVMTFDNINFVSGGIVQIPDLTVSI